MTADVSGSTPPTQHVLECTVEGVFERGYDGRLLGFTPPWEHYPVMRCVKCGRSWPASLAATATPDSKPECDGLNPFTGKSHAD